MQTTTMLTNCITYEQLQAYTNHTSDKNESARIYLHISSCEMCACAINGFAAIPFTSADVAAIHNRIDAKVNAANANPLIFARILIVTISLASIFGFYRFADSFSKKEKMSAAVDKPYVVAVINAPAKNQATAFEQIAREEKKGQKHKSAFRNKVIEKTVAPVMPISSIPAKIAEMPKAEEVIKGSVYNSDVIYIYDLKVADYYGLYFNHAPKQINFGNYTPSYKETKATALNMVEKEWCETVTADRTLKNGLQFFSKGKYARAEMEFHTLLKNNSEDVNALFYEAVCCYQDGNYQRALRNLESVLKNSNNAFYPEAEWNLALVNIKIGNKQAAKQMLREIISEKGFYAKKAETKLKGL